MRQGTYALILRNSSAVSAAVGRWRVVEFPVGVYVYVGSAMGPGGLEARVSRHFRSSARKHWHIDFAREFMRPEEAWCLATAERHEHRWAGIFRTMASANAIPGFGCTDCSCESHLFHFASAPDIATFSEIAGAAIEQWAGPR